MRRFELEMRPGSGPAEWNEACVQRSSARTESIRRLGQVRDFEQSSVVEVRKFGGNAEGDKGLCGSLETVERVTHSIDALFRLC